ncbi:hypothetical protein [Rhodopseudomonas pseudopalustris]|uniref:hypothetical protein n=1 Tax=Rhodopseudomonas pseudopalustris TaxID=1513892 RepID=UPI001113C186|nr:hypothetical protein [Rhodopseudomonas pseudopalustris]
MTRVPNILPKARDRLLLIGEDCQLTEAASLLSEPNRLMVVVCNDTGVTVGVVNGADHRSRDSALPGLHRHDHLARWS